MGGLIPVCFPRNHMQILFSGLEIKKQKTKCIKNDENLAHSSMITCFDLNSDVSDCLMVCVLR